MKQRPSLFAAVLAAMLAISPVAFAGDIETQAVKFSRGSSSSTIKGSIKGYQTIDYTLRASAGQTMTVKLAAKNSANYFNVLPPDSETALFVGSTSGNEWSGTLPGNGEYRVRVYLMRSAARRNEVSSFTLTVGITGGVQHASSHDAKVAGTSYHATGKVPCALGDAKPGSMECDFGVIRQSIDHAELHVTPPGGLKRVLNFAGNKVDAAGAKVSAKKSGDTWMLEVNDYEHYQIPEAVINGG